MGLENAPNGELLATTKFWDEMPGEAGMMFEYAPDGQNVGVVDLEDGDSLRFADVLAALSEPDFYADGLALPPQLADGAIVSVPERFRR